jgi:hypothetical protein
MMVSILPDCDVLAHISMPPVCFCAVPAHWFGSVWLGIRSFRFS